MVTTTAAVTARETVNQGELAAKLRAAGLAQETCAISGIEPAFHGAGEALMIFAFDLLAPRLGVNA